MMDESLKRSLGKALRELAAGAGAAALLGGLAFLSDPAIVAAALKDPSPALLLAIPLINAIARVALDQFRHRKAE